MRSSQPLRSLGLKKDMENRIRSPLGAIVLGFAVVAVNVAAAPQPLIRDGSRPSGYYSSGNYCVPNDNAHFAVPRAGSCPSGYYSSGNYCVAQSDDSKLAIPRTGSCPSGYYSSGDYCVSNK